MTTTRRARVAQILQTVVAASVAMAFVGCAESGALASGEASSSDETDGEGATPTPDVDDEPSHTSDTRPTPSDAGTVVDARSGAVDDRNRDAGRDAGTTSGSRDGAPPPAAASGDGGVAAPGSDGGAPDPADECAGGTSLAASDDPSSKTKPSSQSSASIQFMLTASKNSLKRLRTKLVVPPVPKGSQTLFIWPGVQPGYGNNGTIGNGILQPVLTWGTSCLRFDNKPTWWISGEYVNVSTFDPKYANCHGGAGIEVDVGDELEMIIEANGTVWRQTVTDIQKSKTVTYDIDLGGQLQAWFIWDIEMQTASKPMGDVVFTDSTFTFEKPDEKACQPTVRGTTDYFSGPRISPSKTTCCVDKITLRAPGVAATTKP